MPDLNISNHSTDFQRLPNDIEISRTSTLISVTLDWTIGVLVTKIFFFLN